MSGAETPEARPTNVSPREEKPRTAAADGTTLFEFLKQTYGTADPRSLGLLRIALGTLMFIDLWRRFPDLDSCYSNLGWLPNHFALFRPMSNYLFSLYLAFGSPGEVRVLVFIHLAVLALLIVGYKTRLMQVLAALLTISIGSRNIMLENGGWVVLNLLAVWTLFLPLGLRFSVDALRTSLRARKETTAEALSDASSPKRPTAPVVSFAVAAIILQWAVIYYFNVVHKSGRPWRDGTAVYYFFHQDRMVTWFGALVREVAPIWLFKAMTFSTLVIEALIALLLVLPWKPHISRMVAWLLVCSLHLSIDAVVQLGPFSWTMVVVFFTHIPAQFWDTAGAWLCQRRRRALVWLSPENGALLGFCRLLKRVDTLEMIRYRAFSEETPSAARHTLGVESGGETKTGWAAVLALGDALWFGRRPLVLLGALGGRKLAERSLAKLVGDGDRTSLRLGLTHLPHELDVPPQISEARVALDRVSAVLREGLVLALVVSCGSQVFMENKAIPPRFRLEHRPELLTAMVVYPRMFQGWSMFAPVPPTDDGKLVIDGRTRDGRALDPLTGLAPDFDVEPRGGFRMNQVWGDFMRRVSDDRFRVYWPGFETFVLNAYKISGRPRDEIVAFEAVFISEQIPPPGQPPIAPVRRLLFSHGDIHATSTNTSPTP